MRKVKGNDRVIFLGEANGMHSDRCRAEAVTELRPVPSWWPGRMFQCVGGMHLIVRWRIGQVRGR